MIRWQTKIKGFTLIELLVVVSIIALLVSILLPALSKAREQAKQIVCLSNMKTAALTWQMYSSSNNDIILPVNAKNDEGMTVIWCDRLMPYIGLDKTLRTKSPDKPDETAFMCPSNKELFTDAAGQLHSFNFALNNRSGIVWSNGSTQWLPTKQDRIENPASKIIFSDASLSTVTTYSGAKLPTTNYWTDPGDYYASNNHLVGLCHGGGKSANFMWADGHSSNEYKKDWNTSNLWDGTGQGWWCLTNKYQGPISK